MSASKVKTGIGLLLSVLTGIITSCKNHEPKKVVDAVQVHMANRVGKFEQLDKAKWLIGSWRGVIGEGVSVESWYKQNDSTYMGAGLFIKGHVNLSDESIKLYQIGDDLYYEPTVKGQNGGKPVTFKMALITPTKMVFENMQHDFPQRITYTQYTDDSMVASISGTDKGMVRSESFPMTRKK